MQEILDLLVSLKTRFIIEARRNGSEWKPRGGKKGGPTEDFFKEFGFDWDLNLGGGETDSDNGDDDGSQRPPASTDSPQEGAVLFLEDDDSIGSLWSGDDTGDEAVAPEPDFHHPSSGPTPAQLIAAGWRRTNLPPSSPPSSLSPSSLPSPSISSSTTTLTPPPCEAPPHCVSNGKENFPNKLGTRRKWESKARLSARTVQASYRTAALRILRESNA